MNDQFSLLSAESLVLAYGEREVLAIDSLDIQAEKGTIVGLIGSNGAGKSTLLKAALGLHPVKKGSLRLLGLQAGSREFRQRLAMIGYVPQARPAGILHMTVREVVECGRYGRIGFLGKMKTSDRSAIASALEIAGVTSLASRAIQELSGGQYQRVQLARAFACEPELILLDEPGSHLDSEGRTTIASILATFAHERKVSILLVSHDKEFLSLSNMILEFADRGVELHDA